MVKIEKLLRMLPVFLMAISVTASAYDGDYDEAVNIIKGKSDSKPISWAIGTLQNIENDSLKAQAQNVLGMAYLNGIGVDVDSVAAVNYFESACAGGCLKAYHNLGELWYGAEKSRQDFSKAFSYYKKGAELGSMICNYDLGYMYYKGLGCEQNYESAVACFRKALELGECPECTYMLGLCYRNGYGVEKDETIAEKYLAEAANYNILVAIEEQLRDESEVDEHIVTLTFADDQEVPETMPYVETFINNHADLSGTYQGLLITYDWSGQQVLKEQNLTLSVGKTTDGYCGQWIQDSDTLPFSATLSKDGILTFKDTYITKTDRYFDDEKIKYEFEDAAISYFSNTLTGDLRLYSLLQGEPERPMYMSLIKTGADNMSGNTPDPYYCDIYAYPIAHSNQVEVKFALPEDVQTSKVSFYTQSGVFVQSFNTGALHTGVQKFSIYPSVRNGNYVVSLTADKYHGQTVISIQK